MQTTTISLDRAERDPMIPTEACRGGMYLCYTTDGLLMGWGMAPQGTIAPGLTARGRAERTLAQAIADKSVGADTELSEAFVRVEA